MQEHILTPVPDGNEKMLLVDDEKDLVSIGSVMLEKLGYDVTGVVGSAPALEVFKKSPTRYDLVVSDLKMNVEHRTPDVQH